MVPLRLDTCEDRTRPATTLSRPQLVLKDISQERSPRR